MNLIQYELFASVAQTQNISRTAKQFFISQPAVSHHIKTLEQTLGVELIERTKKGVYLTHAGEEFLPYVQEILLINSTAEARMLNIANGLVSHIRIAMLSSSTFILNDYIAKFCEQHRNIQTEISMFESSEMINALRENSHELYFAIHDMAPDSIGRYKEIVLDDQHLGLFVNKKVAAGMKDNEIDWEHISHQPFISVAKRDFSLYNKGITICRNHGFMPHITQTYNRAEAVIMSVNAGLGVAILPGVFKELYRRDNVSVYPLTEADAESNICCYWDPEKTTDAMNLFIDIIKADRNIN